MKRGFARAGRLVRGMAALGADLPARTYLDVRASYALREYRKRRDRYATDAMRLGLLYDERLVASRTAARLAASGISVRRRGRGDPVRTLAFFPEISWHGQMLAPLRELGPVSHFDYASYGLSPYDLVARKPETSELRRRTCAAFEEYAAEVSRKERVDWVFIYALGIEITPATLARVRAITGAPVVGMCLDDKQSWEDEPFGGEPAGQVAHASSFDLGWTSARVACEWYLVEGGNPVFLGEGCSPDRYSPGPDDLVRDLDVCFIGARYGFRPWFVARLERAGLNVATAGQGWSTGPVSDDDMIALMRRSKVILGLGGVGWSPDLKNVKGRDFDAPCIGAYVTSFNPDLAGMFRIGEEIACYSTPDEAIEVVRELLCNPQKRASLARRGRERCLAEHTWKQRFESLLKLLGVLE
jgi:spore maturation protein CgeB